MRLIELEPRFIRISEYSASGNAQVYSIVDSIADAEGIQFLCPKCFAANHGRIGTHCVLCWNPTISQNVSPKPGRWNLVGTNYNDLSLVAGSSSIQLNGGCNAHFWIKDGLITTDQGWLN